MLQRSLAAFIAATISFAPAAFAGVLPGTTTATDFVFLIDASPSMLNNINAVKAGMSEFVSDLDEANVDARFAIILFGKTGPELILDLTSNATLTEQRLGQILVNGANPGIHNDHNGDPEDSLTAIRAALNVTTTPLAVNNILDESPGHTGRLAFRQNALINLILLTDENSDSAFHSADRMEGQTGTNPPTMDVNFYGSPWQTEVDVTAAAVIDAGAFLNMIVPTCEACPLQYGDPESDISDPDLSNWDEDATLATLRDLSAATLPPGDQRPATASRAEQSLQAQIIDGATQDDTPENLVARAFLIDDLDTDPDFVTNIFAAKVAETVVAVCGDGVAEDEEDCDDANTANGDCCSSTCEFETVGSSCTSDGNACTTDVCNATGTCLHNTITCAADGDPCTADTCDTAAGCNYPDAANGTPCNDGQFCTATDGCVDGTCVGSGSPCGSTECQTVCNEGNNTCADPQNTPCTADSDVCTSEVCNGSGACVSVFNTAPCDDGNECTGDDACLNGTCQGGAGDGCDDLDDCTIDSCAGVTCQHENIQFFSACFGVLIAGDGDTRGKGRIRAGSQALGNACADLGDIGQSTLTDGDWFIMDDSSPKAAKVRGNQATVNGDVATDGGGITAAPKTTDADLFGTGLAKIPTGMIVPKLPSGVVDTTGDHEGLPRCLAAQQNQVSVQALLDALPSDQTFGKLKTAASSTQTFNATNVGGITVIDIQKWSIGNFATINLDGGGSDSTFVIRVDKKLDANAGITWNLINGATAERTVFYVAGGKLEIGLNNTGGGILFTPDGKTVIKAGSTWTGVAIGGKGAELGDNVTLTHAHYQGPNF
ncbi:MAG TPA: VWA domain-containing protein [Candidatus Limnocylindrales bacterium]|nr:VWA domain-containing protein [Candidatus Limnocylindrales bacterium]